MNEKQMVTISKEEYDELNNSSLLLDVLRSWGVDNWIGYGDAMEEYRELTQGEQDE